MTTFCIAFKEFYLSMALSVFFTSLENSRITFSNNLEIKGPDCRRKFTCNQSLFPFWRRLGIFGTVFLGRRKKLVEPFWVPVIWYLLWLLCFILNVVFAEKKSSQFFSVVWIHKYFFLIRIRNYGLRSGRPIYYWSGSGSYLDIFVATSGFWKITGIFLNRYGSKLLQMLHPKPEDLRLTCPSRELNPGLLSGRRAL